MCVQYNTSTKYSAYKDLFFWVVSVVTWNCPYSTLYTNSTQSPQRHDSYAVAITNPQLGCMRANMIRLRRMVWQARSCFHFHIRPVHPPYYSVFVTEFNPEYGNTDLLIWLRKRSSPKYGNAHHLNLFFTVISCFKNVAPSVGNVHVPLYYARCQATRNIP